MLLGIVTMFLLPNRPESTTFFNERERRIALERMNRDSSGDTGATVNKGENADPDACGMRRLTIALAHIWMAIRDWRVCGFTISVVMEHSC